MEVEVGTWRKLFRFHFHNSGVLCGDCLEGLGVSALLNACVSCTNYSGLLIAGLSMSSAQHGSLQWDIGLSTC